MRTPQMQLHLVKDLWHRVAVHRVAVRANLAKIFRSVMDSAGFGQGAGPERIKAKG